MGESYRRKQGLKNLDNLLKDSLEECVMQAVHLKTDKVLWFFLCVGGQTINRQNREISSLGSGINLF